MIRINRFAGFFTLCIFALVTFTRAQTRPTPPSVTPLPVSPVTNAVVAVPDFSQGFASLHRLGVTNVSRATYVVFTGAMSYQMHGGNSPYGANMPQNFGWQLSGDASNGVFLLADGLTVRCATAAQPKKSLPEQRYAGRDGDEEAWENIAATQTLMGVNWKAADLDAEIKRITEKLQKEIVRRDAALAKAGEAGEAEARYMLRMAGQEGQSRAPVLFFATHVADQGRGQEANQLVALAMNLADSRQRLLEEAVDALAGSAYNKVWRRFRGSDDWEAYGRDVEVLAARFSRGWHNVTNAVELARRVRAFTAAGRQAANVSGELSAADRALAAALVTAPRSRIVNQILPPRFLWALPPDTNDMPGAWITTNAHPLARLLRGGTNSIPVLLALLDDHVTLTPFVTTRPLVEAAPDNAGQDEMEMMMQGMYGKQSDFPHPATRADIAALLLEALVGQKETSYHRDRGRSVPDAAPALAERVRAWQSANAGLNTEELAIRMLAAKDYNAPRQAADYLARSSSTSGWQRLEQHMLRDRNPDNLADVAEKYVRRRGPDARPFVEAYAKRLFGGASAVEVPEDVDPQLFKGAAAADPAAKYREKRAKQIVSRLNRIVENKPVTAILDEIAADKRTLADAREDLQELWQMTPQDLLNALINSAAKATNSATRVEILSATEWIPTMARYRRYSPPFGEDPAGLADVQTPLLTPLPAADAWRRLLADTRVPTNLHPVAWQPPTTVSACAAAYMERLCTPGATGDVSTLVNRLGEPACDLLLRRAASRLSGTADIQPPLPDAGRVSAARLNVLTNAVPSAAVIAALTLDERLALGLAVLQNPALAPGLAVRNRRLRVITPAAELAAVSAVLRAGEGQPLSVSFLQGLAVQCEALARQGQRVTFELRQQPGFGGVEASVRPWHPDESLPSPAGGVVVSLLRCEGSDERLVCHPGVASAKIPAAEDLRKRPTDDELLAAEVARIERGPLSPAEAEAAFWKRIEIFCIGDESLGFPAVVSICAVPVIKP